MKRFFLFALVVVSASMACKKQNTRAEFSISKSNYYLTEDVSFTNQSSDGKSYSWDFGDGQTSTQENPVHAYTKAGNYLVNLTAGNSSFTKNIKVYGGTASYQVHNQVSAALPTVSFWVDANDDIQDFEDHSTLATNAKSDTIATTQSRIYVGGFLNTKVFIVQAPYTINKYTHNNLAVTNTTPVVVEQSISSAINALRSGGPKATSFKALPKSE